MKVNKLYIPLFLFMIIFLLPLQILAQNGLKEVTPEDGLFLLDDVEAQISSTEMINSIYNYDFEDVDKQFKKLKDQYGWHPLPYFMKAVGEWWKIEPDTDVTEFDSTFLKYINQTIEIAKGIEEIDKTKLEAAFFLAASHAFKGRLYSERKAWRKAALEAKKSLKYVEECRKHTDLNPELLFGDGLYNYFAAWIPENYPILKPVLLFFHKGNKDKGMEQLREAGRNAFFSRTEAQYFLIRILMLENKNVEEVFQLSEYLHESYPNNPSFHRVYARQLYAMGNGIKMKKECKDILKNIEDNKFGYGPTDGRYASFFMGHLYENYEQADSAKFYYNKVREFVKEGDDYTTGYHLHALLGLMKFAAKNNEKSDAKDYYKEIKKYTKRKDYCFQQAKKIKKTL